MVFPHAHVQWSGLTWPRDDQGKIQTWSVSVTQVPVSNTDSSHSTPCVIFMGLLYLSTQTGGPKITEILSQVLRLKVLNQGVGRTMFPAGLQGRILPHLFHLLTASRVPWLLAASPPSLWSLAGLSLFLCPLLIRRPVSWPHHSLLCGHSLMSPCSFILFLQGDQSSWMMVHPNNLILP